MHQRPNIDFSGELEEVRKLIDRGTSKSAEERARALLKQNPRDANLLSEIRLHLSRALELRALYTDALDVIRIYENEEVTLGLNFEQSCKLKIQIALLYNYLAEHHKSISKLKEVAAEIETETVPKEITGLLQVTFSRAYRALGESAVAQDFAEKSLASYRDAGDRRGMIQSYLALSNVAIQTGDPHTSVEFGLHAINLIGDRSENYWLGRIYSDIAAAMHYLRDPEKGIEYLEKSIRYYSLTEHSANSMGAYNNLGLHLMTTGQWKRSEEALQNAMRIARANNHPSLAVVCGTLGELYLKQGRLGESEALLAEAMSITTGSMRIWARMTVVGALANLAIKRGELLQAEKFANEQAELAAKVNDPEGTATAVLLKAEAALLQGRTRETAVLLSNLFSEEGEIRTDPQIVGQAQFLLGRCAIAEDDSELAVYHLERALAANELTRDVYLISTTRRHLGRLLLDSQPKRAERILKLAAEGFDKLELTSEAADCRLSLEKLSKPTEKKRPQPLNVAFLLMRLAEAAVSRKLLMKEFFSLLADASKIKKSLFIQRESGSNLVCEDYFGVGEDELANIVGDFKSDRKNLGASFQVNAISNGFLLTSPISCETLLDGTKLLPLFKQLELGLEVCRLRETRESEKAEKDHSPFAAPSLLPGFVHTSPEMTALAEEIYRIRESDVTVLVTGESGTGKELVSKSIHANSRRRERAFVPVNCTALPKELAEGQLFGYKKGAFTGAAQDHEGLIRAAHHGTLFLDEIGDLPLDVQPKLLRFLQEGEIQPLGERRPVKVDVRVIAATNVSLEEKVKDGLFREDLYYRLNVIRLRVPPLRERRSEIPNLIALYSKLFSEKFGKKDLVFLPQTVDLLMVCDWDGNVRQLCNEIQRIVARAEDGEVITPEHLSSELKKIMLPTSSVGDDDKSAGTISANRGNRSLGEVVEDLEKALLIEALRQYRGNLSKVSRELKISRRSLYMKLEKYELYTAQKNPYAQ